MGTQKATECKECGVERNDEFYGKLCKDCYLSYCRDYYHKNSEKSNKSTMEWRENNIEQYREMQRLYQSNRYNDPDKKRKMQLKNRFGNVLKQWITTHRLDTHVLPTLKEKTLTKIEELIGCDFSMLIDRFEKQWKKDYGCDIDWNDMFIKSCDGKLELEHIMPVRAFDFTMEQDVDTCWHFGNLKMLKQIDNRTGRPVRV